MRGIRGLRERLSTPVVRNGLYLIATEVVGAVLGLLFWAVAGRLLPDAEVGVGTVLITSGTLVATLSTLGFNVSLVRFLPERGTRVARLINSSVTLGVVVAVVLSTSFGVLAGSGLPALAFLSRNPVLLALFVFFVAVWTTHLLFDAAFIGLGAAKYVLLRSVIYNGLKVPLPLLLVAVFVAPTAPFALFSSWGVALLVSNAIAAVLLLRRVVTAFRLRPDLDRPAVRSMLRYSAMNHVTNVLGALPGLVLPFLVALALPAENAVYFYVAWVIANFLFIVPGSVFTSVFAEGSRWLAGLHGHAIDGLYLSVALLVPLVVAVLLGGPLVLGAIKPSFRAATPLLDVLAVSSFFVALNVLYITVLRVGKRMRPVVGIYLGTSLGALALGYPLMLTPLGVLGVGLGFAIAQAAGAAYSVWAMRREGTLRVRA